MADDPDRRGFLKVATCALGGGLGIVLAAPALRLVLDPATQTTVTTPTDPIDLGPVDRFRSDKPLRVEVIAPLVKDAWTTARDVVLGAAWIQTQNKQLVAHSAVCPHLGCGIGFDGAAFNCPCHDSKFALTGERMTGPSKRGMDPLQVDVKDGRLRLTWVTYKLDTTDREKA
jgi:menaquinol-cytochrome c reductase iron-sulfur subunit